MEYIPPGAWNLDTQLESLLVWVKEIRSLSATRPLQTIVSRLREIQYRLDALADPVEQDPEASDDEIEQSGPSPFAASSHVTPIPPPSAAPSIKSKPKNERGAVPTLPAEMYPFSEPPVELLPFLFCNRTDALSLSAKLVSRVAPTV
jgi:hypothetical protein